MDDRTLGQAVADSDQAMATMNWQARLTLRLLGWRYAAGCLARWLLRGDEE